eukprot:GHVQ01024275.1.p1 GENE.GHVQ01024275.1~~GHVQ01024275.1.p1  ORF type:complete len:1615 (+),score=230.86 GHVQ01024275.1:163-5007(+)
MSHSIDVTYREMSRRSDLSRCSNPVQLDESNSSRDGSRCKSRTRHDDGSNRHTPRDSSSTRTPRLRQCSYLQSAGEPIGSTHSKSSRRIDDNRGRHMGMDEKEERPREVLDHRDNEKMSTTQPPSQQLQRRVDTASCVGWQREVVKSFESHPLQVKLLTVIGKRLGLNSDTGLCELVSKSNIKTTDIVSLDVENRIVNAVCQGINRRAYLSGSFYPCLRIHNNIKEFWSFFGKYLAKLFTSIEASADTTAGYCRPRSTPSPYLRDKDREYSEGTPHNRDPYVFPKVFNRRYAVNFAIRTNGEVALVVINDSDYASGDSILLESLPHLLMESFHLIVLLFVQYCKSKELQKLKDLRSQQQALPVCMFKDNIIQAIKQHPVTLISADTGCGKSTQIPQFLLEHADDLVSFPAVPQATGSAGEEAGSNEWEVGHLDEEIDMRSSSSSRRGRVKILCTEPRRLAAITLCKRVAMESFHTWDDTVGYQIRFDRFNKTSKTRVVFVTEGLALRLLETDPLLEEYGVLILDEVHERHVSLDMLMGIIKNKILPYRSDDARITLPGITPLKVVLMSASINMPLFAQYFELPPSAIVTVPGKMYPVTIEYLPQLNEPISIRDDVLHKQQRPTIDTRPYLRILEEIDTTYSQTERGDVLIFLSGAYEIDCLVEAINTQYLMPLPPSRRNWIVLPLHAQLQPDEQDKAFGLVPPGIRKCIVSTNISETSVTIDGVRFVVDSGRFKVLHVHPSSLVKILSERWISQASALQRAGRAGRTGPGRCYRLYSERLLGIFSPFTLSEIASVPLPSVFLHLVALGCQDVCDFPWIEPPSKQNIVAAVEALLLSAAIVPFLQSPSSTSRSESLSVSSSTTQQAEGPANLEDELVLAKDRDEGRAGEVEVVVRKFRCSLLGYALSVLPVEHNIGKMLLLGASMSLMYELTLCAASIGIRSPFVTSSLCSGSTHRGGKMRGQRRKGEDTGEGGSGGIVEIGEGLVSPMGDLTTTLHVFQQWLCRKLYSTDGNSDSTNRWCRSVSVDDRKMSELTRLYSQLVDKLNSNLYTLTQCTASSDGLHEGMESQEGYLRRRKVKKNRDPMSYLERTREQEEESENPEQHAKRMKLERLKKLKMASFVLNDTPLILSTLDDESDQDMDIPTEINRGGAAGTSNPSAFPERPSIEHPSQSRIAKSTDHYMASDDSDGSDRGQGRGRTSSEERDIRKGRAPRYRRNRPKREPHSHRQNVGISIEDERRELEFELLYGWKPHIKHLAEKGNVRMVQNTTKKRPKYSSEPDESDMSNNALSCTERSSGDGDRDGLMICFIIGLSLYPNIALPCYISHLPVTTNTTTTSLRCGYPPTEVIRSETFVLPPLHDCMFVSRFLDYALVHPHSSLYSYCMRRPLARTDIDAPVSKDRSSKAEDEHLLPHEAVAFCDVLQTHKLYITHCTKVPAVAVTVVGGTMIETNREVDCLIVDKWLQITGDSAVMIKVILLAATLRKEFDSRLSQTLTRMFSASNTDGSPDMISATHNSSTPTSAAMVSPSSYREPTKASVPVASARNRLKDALRTLRTGDTDTTTKDKLDVIQQCHDGSEKFTEPCDDKRPIADRRHIAMQCARTETRRKHLLPDL